MRIAIATASNEGYYASLQALLSSIEGVGQWSETVSIHILDVGLSVEQRESLLKTGHHLIQPGWDVDISAWKGVPEWFKAMSARPFLPQYITQADLILWLDADIWVQDLDMLYDFVRAARQGQLAVCLELERTYANVFLKNASREIYHDNLSRYYGPEVANRLIHFPLINCGAFALMREHPLWKQWQTTMSGAIKKYCSNFLEQTALNMTVYTQNIQPHFLPARHNWMACHAQPLWDESRGIYVEPNLPHDKIGLMHLACGLWKRDDLSIESLQGNRLKGPLRAFRRQ
jgi:lipopolysaccharide biosynthesis glycosyltransferase